jgi:hypothetical protein
MLLKLKPLDMKTSCSVVLAHLSYYQGRRNGGIRFMSMRENGKEILTIKMQKKGFGS